MTAKEFWERFEKVCKDEKLIDSWNNTKKFTTRMFELLENVVKEEECSIEYEYFRIDLITYKNTKTSDKIGYLKNYSWELLTAVEHENDSRLWVDEVVKLAHISAELRVVIGYIPLAEKTNQEKYMDEVSTIINSISAWKQTKDKDFLLIIGDSRINDKKERCNYTPYVYNREEQRFKTLK
ncbi:MAG: hypothetical protein IJW54_04170 [Clostridia bacterium]|nr:hypothetical protein [Clostridia bacterium]